MQLAVMMFMRFTLSLRNVENLLHEQGIGISHKKIRSWWWHAPTLLQIHQIACDEYAALPIIPLVFSTSWNASGKSHFIRFSF